MGHELLSRMDGKARVCVIFFMALAVIAVGLIIELVYFEVGSNSDNVKSQLDLHGGSFYINSYNREEKSDRFTPIANDPQLIFKNVNINVHTITLSFFEPTKVETPVQVFFASGDQSFSEANSVQTVLRAGATSAKITIPQKQYSGLRLDIDGPFSLKSIITSYKSNKIVPTFVPKRLIMSFALAGMILLLAWVFFKYGRNKNRLAWQELLYVLMCTAFYMLWAIAKPLNYAPDEYMRYVVPLFLYNNGHMPVGTETINAIWGFSYAQSPTQLAAVCNALFMKITSLYSKNAFALLVGARMVSVLSGSIFAVFMIKIAKRFFQSPVRWIMIVLCTTLPQLVFLTSSVNNDMLSILGSAIIVYAWCLIYDQDWNYSNCLLLAIGIAICATTYYFTYGWILLSITFFILLWIVRKKQLKVFLKYSLFVSCVMLVLISYFFIRMAVLYNGDLLGHRTAVEFGERYAQHDFKPSVKLSLMKQNVPLNTMLYGRLQWVYKTYQSFLGVFGHMNVFMTPYTYTIYGLFIMLSFTGAIYGFYAQKRKGLLWNKELAMGLALGMVGCAIPVALSVYNSYTSDFEPQGRYIMCILPMLSIFVTFGIESLLSLLRTEKARFAATGVICAMLCMLLLSEYFVTYL